MDTDGYGKDMNFVYSLHCVKMSSNWVKNLAISGLYFPKVYLLFFIYRYHGTEDFWFLVHKFFIYNSLFPTGNEYIEVYLEKY